MSNKDTIIEALTMQLKIEREGNLALVKRIAELERPVYVDSSRFSKSPSGHKPGMVITAPVYASDISQECVDKTAKDRHEWGNVTDDALIEEVRRRGFPIRDAQISPKIKDEYELCCQKYDTCTEPCTPRGKHLAKRELVGLTEVDIYDAMDNEDEFEFARAIEAKLKEKNNG